MKQIFYHVLFHAKAFNAIVRLYPRRAIRENSDSARGQRILHSYVLEVPRHTADGMLEKSHQKKFLPCLVPCLVSYKSIQCNGEIASTSCHTRKFRLHQRTANSAFVCVGSSW